MTRNRWPDDSKVSDGHSGRQARPWRPAFVPACWRVGRAFRGSAGILPGPSLAAARWLAVLALLSLGADGYKSPTEETGKGKPAPVLEKKVLGTYPNGRIIEEYTCYRNVRGDEVRHGIATDYFENGEKSMLVNYHHGQREGKMIEWDSSGQVIREGAWKNDREIGLWAGWSASGKKQWECFYWEGHIVGKKVYYDKKSGKPVRVEVYDEDGNLSELTAWYSTIESPEPALQFHGTFKKRKEIRSLKDIARTDLFRGPDKHGTWTYWSREGDLKAAGIWKAGKPWEGTCGIPLAGEAGSIAGVERFVLYRQGQAVPEEPSP